MTTMQRSILIDAPLETVFAYISDYTHDGEWRRGVIHVEQTPPPPSRLGTHPQAVSRYLGVRFTICAEVTQFKANNPSSPPLRRRHPPRWPPPRRRATHAC